MQIIGLNSYTLLNLMVYTKFKIYFKLNLSNLISSKNNINNICIEQKFLIYFLSHLLKKRNKFKSQKYK